MSVFNESNSTSVLCLPGGAAHLEKESGEDVCCESGKDSEHLQFRRCFWQSGSLPVITIFCPPEICFRLDFKNSSGACGAFRLSVISVNHPRRSGIWDPRRSGVHPIRLRFPGRGCGGSSPRHQARCPSTSDVDVR